VGAKWARNTFPLVITFFTFILVANWLHFFPIVDSVGLIHCAPPDKFQGWEVNELGSSGIYTLNAPRAEGGLFPSPEFGAECPDKGADEEVASAGGVVSAQEGDIRYFVSPFFRTATTDLSLTLTLSIIAMVAVQIWGVKELGAGYFSKFVNLPALSHGPLGFIEFIVGFLELVSEFLKVVSFALRLLGNLFAGTILLFVMLFLVPVGLPLPFFFFEVLIGLLQAFVFAMLIMVFTSVAQIGHGDHGDDDHH
jgi:F-type H+-transporting ATPase subunit a